MNNRITVKRTAPYHRNIYIQININGCAVKGAVTV